ncbi:hypothetical protein CWN19_22055 [Klebsiella pneumoniae]|nr:hypothetical protein [Klebsiella pneumoniae]EIW8505110.1 hypothetical protein [Klebsiella pneumoniae]PLO49519.1 hypothetical protein CWN19_22055 [Klebsiella pneumoniae]
MKISNDLVPGAAEHTGPVLVYLERGQITSGFVLLHDEFVTSIATFVETRKITEYPPCSLSKNSNDL